MEALAERDRQIRGLLEAARGFLERALKELDGHDDSRRGAKKDLTGSMEMLH